MEFLISFSDCSLQLYKNTADFGNSLVVQWLGFGVSLPGASVQSLLRELRSRKLRGAAKKQKNN